MFVIFGEVCVLGRRLITTAELRNFILTGVLSVSVERPELSFLERLIFDLFLLLKGVSNKNYNRFSIHGLIKQVYESLQQGCQPEPRRHGRFRQDFQCSREEDIAR